MSALAQFRRPAAYDPRRHPHFYCEGTGYTADELAGGPTLGQFQRPEWKPAAVVPHGLQRRFQRCQQLVQRLRDQLRLVQSSRPPGTSGVDQWQNIQKRAPVLAPPTETYPDVIADVAEHVLEDYLLGGLSSGVGLDELGRRKKKGFIKKALRAVVRVQPLVMVARAFKKQAARKKARGRAGPPDGETEYEAPEVGPPAEAEQSTEEKVREYMEDRAAPKQVPPGFEDEPRPAAAQDAFPKFKPLPPDYRRCPDGSIVRGRQMCPRPRDETAIMPDRAEAPPPMHAVPGEHRARPDTDDESVPPPFEDEVRPPPMVEPTAAQAIEPGPAPDQEMGTLRQFEIIKSIWRPIRRATRPMRRGLLPGAPAAPGAPPPEEAAPGIAWYWWAGGALAVLGAFLLLRGGGRRR